MADSDTPNLVSTAWLAEHLHAPDVRVVDGTFFLPSEGRDARAEFQEERIPGAVFFDIDEIADAGSDLPHMLPSPEKFSAKVRKLGLGDGVRIVIYDRMGLRSSPRVWWTFKVFGHGDVAVLDGGLAKWKAEGHPLEHGPPREPGERHFTARMNATMVRDKDQLARNLESGKEQVLDARAAGRFEGSDPEPREGLRSGHIPSSLNLPFSDLIDAESGTFLPAEEIRKRFEDAGIDYDKPVVTTCGSGVTAAVLAMGLEMTGHKKVAVYDGSWSEWGAADDVPVETGPAKRG